MNGIEELLKKYGTSLEETRKLMPELVESIKRQRAARPPMVPTTPQFFTAEEVRGMGLVTEAGDPFELELGWRLKVTPPVDGQEPVISYITPEDWEITQDQMYISPTGERFTREQIEAQLAAPEVPLEVEQVFGAVFPERDVAEVLAYVEAKPEDFYRDILAIGRTEETETFLKTIFPEITPEQIDQIFAPVKAPSLFRIPGVRTLEETKALWRERGISEEEIEKLLKQQAFFALDIPEEGIEFMLTVEEQGVEVTRAATLLPDSSVWVSGENIGRYDPAIEQIVPWAVGDITEVAWQAWGETPWGAGFAPWDEAVSGFPGPIDLLRWIAPTKFGRGLGLVGSYWQKYISRPWETFILETRITCQTFYGLETEGDKWAQARLDDARDKYGWAMYFSPDVSNIYEAYVQQSPTYVDIPIRISEWCHPVYWLPVGKAAGVVARYTSKIPIIGKITARTAAAVTKAEMAIVYPMTKPMDIAYRKTFGAAIRSSLRRWGTSRGVTFPRATQNQVSKIILNRVPPDKLTGMVIRDLFTKEGTATAAAGTAATYAEKQAVKYFPLLTASSQAVVGATPATTTAIVAVTEKIISANIPTASITAGLVASIIPPGLTLEITDSLTAQLKEMGFAPDAIGAMSADEAWANLFKTAAPEVIVPPPKVPGVDISGMTDGEAAKIIAASDHLLMELPVQADIIKAALQSNWGKTLAEEIGKFPAGKELIKLIDPRELVSMDAATIEALVAREAIGFAEVVKMGQNAAAVKMGELQGITTNPVKMFGFNKDAYSAKMISRLLPDYKGTVEAGTLEHIFTHPEMYSWGGFDKGLKYVTTVHEINTEVFNLLKKEGVAPALSEQAMREWWIHRVVEGRYDADGELIAIRGRPGMRGLVAAKRGYEMQRKAPTMFEGMSWHIKYAENPEVSVRTYIEDAFIKMAQERFYQGTDTALEAIGKAGVTPSDVLKELHPDVIGRFELAADELKAAANFHSVINRAIRGERTPEQTLRAIERRFPDLGKRFRALVKEPAVAETQLRAILAQNEKLIKSLRAKLEKAEAIDIEAIKAEARTEAIATGIPDEQKLVEAFRIMDYEDRLAFRSTIESQMEDIGRMLAEEEAELAGILEFLKTDPVATYHGTVRGKRVPLTSVLVKGQFPETFSVAEATMLMMGRTPKTIIKGRVPREVVIDELAQHFKMEEQQLIDHIEHIAEQRVTAKDLRTLVTFGNNRATGIKRMLELLDKVDTVPRYIPKAEPGMPEAGMQQDMFGYETPHFPAGKGKVTQISMDDYNKLVEYHKQQGLPPPDVGIKPVVEGVKGLEPEAQFKQVTYDVPPVKSVAERNAALDALRKEVKLLTELRKVPYWKARAERAAKMELVRQPPIGEGFIMQSHFSGKIYDQEFIDAVNAFFGHKSGLKILKPIADLSGILTTAKAALDVSFPAIQGMPAFGLAHSYFLTNPKIGAKLLGAWFKAFAYPIRAYLQPEWMHRIVAKNEADALQRISFGGSSMSIDYFRALRARGGLGGFAAEIMHKIPFTPYERAELAFYGAGEIIRNEFWNILKDNAIKQGAEFNLAQSLDRMTGLISSEKMGITLTQRQLERSFMFFAPQYTRACLTFLGNVFRGGYTGAHARRALGGLIAAGAMYYAAVQYAIATLEGKDHDDAWDTVLEGFGLVQDPITGDWEWRPTARFMTIRVGNYNFGVGGFWYGLVRLAGNISACINEIGEREVIDLVRIFKNGSFNRRDNPLIYWWWSRSSMVTHGIAELGSGKDFLGYPIETPWEYSRYLMEMLQPIWVEQGVNWMIPGMARDNEIPEGAARAAIIPAELFGLRTFPESQWVKFYDKASEYIKHIPEDELDEKQIEAWRDGKLEWRHLTDIQQINLLSRYPELNEIYTRAQADSAVRDSGIWKQWSGRTDEERTVYYERGDNLVQRLQLAELDTREFREMWSEAGQNYGIALDTIEKEPTYSEIYDYFEKAQSERGEKYGFLDDLALGEYIEIIFRDYLDDKGDYDWDAKDIAVDEYIEKWGDETYERIRQMYADKKLLAGVSPALIRLSDDKDALGREYWQLPYKPIKEMDEDDELEGNIPAEYFGLWKQYQALETDAERDAFIETNPLLAKDWRAEYRKDHPEDDARLALWGYGGKLQSMEAYNLVTKWAQELGIPLEQMGLGLPPRSLIEQYFEHAEIVKETSGGSVQAKLYKLEHPGWLDWGVENWGWGDLSDENIDVLKLRIDFKEQFTLHENYGNPKAEGIYIEKDVDRADKRRAMLFDTEDNLTDFGKAYYTKEAYAQGYSEENWDGFIELSSLPIWGDWRERLLLLPENKSLYDEWISEEVGEGHPLITEAEVSPLKRDEIYLEFIEQFKGWDDVAGKTKAQVKAMRDNLLLVTGFHDAIYRVDAYDVGFPEPLHNDYVEWYVNPPKRSDDPWFDDKPKETFYGDEWWLMEHPEFEKAMVQLYKDTDGKQGWAKARDFSKVPTKAVFALYKTYVGIPQGTPQLNYRARHLDLDAWGVLKFGWIPIGQRGKKAEPKTPWEIQQEVERFKEKFD